MLPAEVIRGTSHVDHHQWLFERNRTSAILGLRPVNSPRHQPAPSTDLLMAWDIRIGTFRRGVTMGEPRLEIGGAMT
jgi:hypothetical protein